MKKGTLSLSIYRCINYGKTFFPAQILKSGGVILVLQVPTFSAASYAQEPASYTLLYCFMLPMCNLCKVGENETTF